jgi:carboxymethylenebutenolidase
VDTSALPAGGMRAIAAGTDAFVSIAPEEGPKPIIVLCHERYGLVKHTCDLTQQFAAAGYVGIAPDLYSDWDGDKEALQRGDVTADAPDPTIQRHITTAIDYAKENGGDPDRVAVVGICASGAYPILSNAVNPEIGANVIMYGGCQDREWTQPPEMRPVPYEDMIAACTAPFLGVFAEADWVCSIPEVLHLRNSLESHRKSYSFRIWRDMPHGWLNDTMPGRYRHRESNEAFLAILGWLDTVWAGGYPPDKVRWEFRSDMRPDYEPGTFTRLA